MRLTGVLPSGFSAGLIGARPTLCYIRLTHEGQRERFCLTHAYDHWLDELQRADDDSRLKRTAEKHLRSLGWL